MKAEGLEVKMSGDSVELEITQEDYDYYEGLPDVLYAEETANGRVAADKKGQPHLWREYAVISAKISRSLGLHDLEEV